MSCVICGNLRTWNQVCNGGGCTRFVRNRGESRLIDGASTGGVLPPRPPFSPGRVVLGGQPRPEINFIQEIKTLTLTPALTPTPTADPPISVSILYYLPHMLAEDEKPCADYCCVGGPIRRQDHAPPWTSYQNRSSGGVLLLTVIAFAASHGVRVLRHFNQWVNVVSAAPPPRPHAPHTR